MKSFLIIGMAPSATTSAGRSAKQVRGHDSRPERRGLEDMLPYVASAKICDCTNIEVLRSFGVQKFDACFVCVNQAFQACLEITDQLKELGAKRVYSKADRDLGGQVPHALRGRLHHLPERDAAERIAVRESSDRIFDFIGLSGGLRHLRRSRSRRSGSAAPWPRSGCATGTASTSTPPSAWRAAPPCPGPGLRIRKDEHVLVLGSLDDIRKVTRD